MAGPIRGDSYALIARREKDLPYLPSRTNPSRNLGLYKTRRDMGCPAFDFNKALARALSSYRATERLTYLEPAKSTERGDLRFHYPFHPERMGNMPGWGWNRWVYNQTEDGSATIARSLGANIPVVGVINLEYYQPERIGHSHLISYVLRRRGETNELILLEPYDTDVLVKVGEGVGWLGLGLKPGWREEIKQYFETNMGVSPLALIAPMAGVPIADFDLTKKDAGEGQCASWAKEMLEAVAALDLRTATPAEMLAAMRPLQAGGRRRKTRRSKRTKRRGTRHARVR